MCRALSFFPTTGDLPENPEAIDLSQQTTELGMDTCFDLENSEPKNSPLVSVYTNTGFWKSVTY